MELFTVFKRQTCCNSRKIFHPELYTGCLHVVPASLTCLASDCLIGTATDVGHLVDCCVSLLMEMELELSNARLAALLRFQCPLGQRQPQLQLLRRRRRRRRWRQLHRMWPHIDFKLLALLPLHFCCTFYCSGSLLTCCYSLLILSWRCCCCCA